jgi:two-component system, response regulator RegA
VGRSILVVDDDATFRETLARAFRDRGYRVQTAADVRTALASATTDTPDFAVVDYNLGRESGSDVLAGLLALCPSIRVAIFTGSRSVDAADLIRRGVIACLRKPAEVDHLLAILNGDATTAT